MCSPTLVSFNNIAVFDLLVVVSDSCTTQMQPPNCSIFNTSYFASSCHDDDDDDDDVIAKPMNV